MCGLSTSDVIQMVGVIASLLLAYIAIYGKEAFLKVKFSYEIVKIDQQVNGVTLQMWRLVIKNVGNRLAEGTLVEVVEIEDRKDGRYYKREDFIHMPLEWTNQGLDQKRINVARNQEVFVDIGQYNILPDENDLGLKLHTNPRVEAQNLSLIPGDAKLRLRIIEQHGYYQDIRIKIKTTLTGLDISKIPT